ncbi:MAG: eight-cysteine-cluster domain-containing protein [archaeon]
MKKLIAILLITTIMLSGCTQEETPPIPPTDGLPIKEPPSTDGEFCGTSTDGPCSTDSDCTKGGCSGQVCQSIKEKSAITTCEYRECYNARNYNLACRCTDSKCRWS